MSRLVDLFDAQKGLLQFIDIFDIGSLLKIELAEKGICSLLASRDITLPLGIYAQTTTLGVMCGKAVSRLG